MLELEDLGNILTAQGFDFFCGVPCSILNSLVHYAEAELDYVSANNEGEAVAACAGAYLGGRRGVALMQNTGLTNALSPLVTLLQPFQIPILGLVSVRGDVLFGDEPQHGLIGRITTSLLDLAELRWEYLSPHREVFREQAERARGYFDRNQSFFFVVRKGVLGSAVPRPRDRARPGNEEVGLKSGDDEAPLRPDLLKALQQVRHPGTLVLTSTGFASRELFLTQDSPGNFYMVGSLGCVSAIALGLSRAQPDRKVIALDGDGGLLMRMGTLATNGLFGPDNFLHLLLDNQAHESTGGHSSHRGQVGFVEIAASCGYRRALYVHNREELQEQIVRWQNDPRLTFLHIRISSGTLKNLGRLSLPLPDVAARMRTLLASPC